MGNTQFVQRKRSLRKDSSGALEGLPLYMVILVVVAAVAMVVLLSWADSAEGRDLDKIEISPDSISEIGGDKTVTVTAYDTSGEVLEGVTVTLDGAGVSKIAKTNTRGEAKFTFDPDLLGESYGEIVVKASYTGTLPIEKVGTIIVN